MSSALMHLVEAFWNTCSFLNLFFGYSLPVLVPMISLCTLSPRSRSSKQPFGALWASILACKWLGTETCTCLVYKDNPYVCSQISTYAISSSRITSTVVSRSAMFLARRTTKRLQNTGRWSLFYSTKPLLTCMRVWFR